MFTNMKHGLKANIFIVYLAVLLVCAAYTTVAIHLIGSEEYATEGREYTLICNTTDNPTRSVDFWDRGKDKHISTIIVHEGQCRVKRYNDTQICDPNICSCINDGDDLGFEFMWKMVINSSYYLFTWACLTKSGVDSEITINTKVPMSSVNIKHLDGFNNLTLEEGKNASLTCVCDSCRPALPLFWYIGGKNYTSWSSYEVVKENGSYVTISNLTIIPTRHSSGKKIICTGSNIENATIESSQQPLLIVQYAPVVNIYAQTFTEGDRNVELKCEVNGEPNNYQFGFWKQTYGSTIIRNPLIGQGNLITTPGLLKFKNITLEDIGTYSCEVQNGIIGPDDKLMQTGSMFINVTASPKILQNTKLYEWSEYKPFKLALDVFSNPAVLKMEFRRYFPDVKISNLSVVQVSFTESLVYVSLHGKTVPMPGHTAELNIFNFTSDVVGKYVLNVTNAIGTTVHVFNLALQCASTTEIKTTFERLNLVLIVVSSVSIFFNVVAVVCIKIRQARDTKRSNKEVTTLDSSSLQPQEAVKGIAEHCYESLHDTRTIQPGTGTGIQQRCYSIQERQSSQESIYGIYDTIQQTDSCFGK